MQGLSDSNLFALLPPKEEPLLLFFLFLYILR